MDRKLVRAIAVVGLVAAMGATAGCRRVPIDSVEDPRGGRSASRTSDSVELEGATSVTADIEMGAGVLTIGGDADSGMAMDASYDYNRSAWEPRVEYGVSQGEGKLSLTQGDIDIPDMGGRVRNEWDIQLPGSVPLDVDVEMGAGESRIDLRDTLLRSLNVDLGAGESTIDLSGAWTDDVAVDISAGVGALELRVPDGIGVRIWGGNEGIGEYTVDRSFRRDGEYYVNDAWGDSTTKMDVRIQRGVGEVKVTVAP